ncbi:oxygenase MpaB family protein [Gordonia paraffinivorans]|uniref:oxygenase MpaB family protein n=1 Tax=Gordonia paraffinivorans TaxID=175628 RepID=UPI00289D8E40|nr:oxygenase MpaB family protein [Gordonia paraffinivorans]
MHEHLPTIQIAMGAAARMETLHPDMAWMAYEHTRAIERVNGVPTGRFDEKAMQSRSGHTLSFFFGVAMASTPVAERVTRTVRAMHDRVEGVRPDGHPYKASDPDLLTWNYCTQAWAIAAAHKRFHPNPLSDERMEEFFHDYARMGRELGGANVPTTKKGVDDYLADSLPYLGVTMPTVELLNPTAPWRYPVWQRPVMTLVDWAIQDLHPQWAQKLMNTRQYPKPVAAARRRMVKGLLNGFRDGKIKEVYEAYERVGATPQS